MSIKFVKQSNQVTLAYDDQSGVSLLEIDGLFFKDLNKNGKLDPYEDYRLPIEVRVANLVSLMSDEEIAGLMLYSKHQAVSSADDIFSMMFAGTYDGKPFKEANVDISTMSDEQKAFLKDDFVRHVLVTTVDDAEVAAKWSNNLQSYAESIGLGIPVNISTDPRHAPTANTEFNAGAGGEISKWPEPLGLAATFDKDLVKKFGQIAAKEYRALGITTALSPQIDLATEPRWMRFNGTFGEDTQLATDLARAYIDDFQTTKKGWGNESVNAMVKHWPGGGSGEAGRDAHYAYGQYAVYPGNNFDEHLIPFTEGAFKLEDGTHYASAVMPYYTISYDQDHKYHENVGNSYSKYIIQDLLRNKYKYPGVVCTDWMITQDNTDFESFLTGKSWGVSDLTEAERHFKILEAGVDQFGGNNDIKPVLEAFEMGYKKYGDEWRVRIEESAKRLLTNVFNTGLFENPYLNPKESLLEVGKAEYVQEGYDAQRKSIVLLKNKNSVLPVAKKAKVYIPNRRVGESVDWFGNPIAAHEVNPIEDNILNKYYQRTDSPEDADFALVFVNSPNSLGYNKEEGYLPLSLQYRPYTAHKARAKSIAADASYKDKTNITTNEADLDIILETVAVMDNKPTIVSINAMNPMVVKEFENKVDGIIMNFNTQNQAILDIVSGAFNPYGLLPFQMPKDMDTIEEQHEDVAHDLACHVDSENNKYDFAFGLNFDGVINDGRVKTYKK